MKLVVTIDTEEDNWGDFRREDYSVENIEMIPDIQRLFDEFDVKPTYLVDYPVIANEKASSIFREILSHGKCEIGAHCHPWNTPPFEEERNPKNSMLCNLPPELQYRKLEALNNAIRDNLSIEPRSFRAGRWGFSSEVAENIYSLGYRVETSVTPFVDWSRFWGPDFSNEFPNPYWFSTNSVRGGRPKGRLLEVPASVGFLQRNFDLAHRVHSMFKGTKLVNGTLSRLRIVNKVWLSPESSTSREMAGLTRRLVSASCGIINMTFHSPSLKYGLTPFVRTQKDAEEFLSRIRRYLGFVRDMGIDSIRLCDALDLVS